MKDTEGISHVTASSNHGRKPALLLAMIGAIVALALLPSVASAVAPVPALTLKLGSAEDYQFKAGDTITADTSSLGSGDKYVLFVTEPDGTTTHPVTSCSSRPNGNNPGGTYTLTGVSPTTSADWTFTEQIFASATDCSGAVSQTLTKNFNIAAATSYDAADLPQTVFGAGSSAKVSVAGLDQSQTWSVTWKAGTTTQCANTAGVDRPGSDPNGVLPTTSKLQYQPGLTGDAWNISSNYDGSCPAFGAANSGGWVLRLQSDTTHFVELPAFTVDGVAPTPTVTTPANNSFTNGTPSLGGTIGTHSGDIAAVTVGLYNGTDTNVAPIQTPTGNVTSPNWSTDPVSTLTDGQYTAKVSQSDSVGNTGSGTSTFTVDTQNPTVAFTLTPSSPDGQNGWYVTKPTVHVVATDTNINTLSCTLNGSPVTLSSPGSTSTTKSGNVPLPNGAGNADGTNSVHCTAQDKATNSGTGDTSFKLDTVNPTVNVTITPGTPNGSNSYYTSIDSLVVNASDAQVLSDLTCTDTLDSGTPTSLPVQAISGDQSLSVSSDGSHVVSCTGTDEAGRQKTTNQSFLLDEHAPAVGLTHPADGGFTNDATPTLDGAAGTASGDQQPVNVSLWSGTDTSQPAAQTFIPDGSSGSWSADAAPLSDGTYTVQASQTDLAGNVGTSSTHTFVVDTVNPTATIALNPASPNGANGTYTSAPTVHVTGDDTNISGFSCTVDGTARAVTNVTGSGSHLEADVPVSGDGQHTVTCNAVDGAGNSSSAVSATFTVATPAVAASSSSNSSSSSGDGAGGIFGSGGTSTNPSFVTLAGAGKQNPLKQHEVVIIKTKCTQACDLLAGGTLSVPNAAKAYKFAQLKKHLSSGGTATLKLKIPKKALKSLKKAIATKKSSIAKIKVTAKAGGSSSNAQRTIVLKR